MASLQQTERAFDRVGHVLDAIRRHEEAGRKRLTPSAKFLAVVLARRSRSTADGRWAIWRGRKSIAGLTGFSERTVNVARRELLEAGLFCHVSGATFVPTPDGKEHPVARGVMVLQMIVDVEAFLQARDAKRSQLNSDRADALHPQKLALQKQRQDFGGHLTEEQYHARMEKLTKRPRSIRKVG